MTEAESTFDGLATPITAERKPIAAKAKKVAENSPSAADRQSAASSLRLLTAIRATPDRRQRDRRDQRDGGRIVERDEAEERDLRRLGLGIGDRDDEALGAHRREHHRGRDHLRDRAERRPAEIERCEPRQAKAGHGQQPREEHRRERQAEQESHLRRAHRSKRADQVALHRVAQRLGARREQRDGNPNRSERHARALPCPGGPAQPALGPAGSTAPADSVASASS
jgi:hypothetical protein